MIIDVTMDSLASVLVMDYDMEAYPEPYRGHADITLNVSYGEYLDFIRYYLAIDDYLATDTTLLKYYLRENKEDLLVKAFYKDVSLAILKELWYTTGISNPTNIVHNIEGCAEFNHDIVGAYVYRFGDVLPQIRKDILRLAEKRGYAFKQQLTRHRKEWDYATILFGMSSHDDRYGIGCMRWSMKGD